MHRGATPLPSGAKPQGEDRNPSHSQSSHYHIYYRVMKNTGFLFHAGESISFSDLFRCFLTSDVRSVTPEIWFRIAVSYLLIFNLLRSNRICLKI